MNRLDRLVLGEIIAPFFVSIALFTSLFMGADDFLKIFDYAAHGVPFWTLVQFFCLALPPILSLTTPMGMLLAALFGVGRLSGDSELVALSAAGVPLERILAPVLAFGFIVSCTGAWLNDTVVPAAARGRQIIIDEQKQASGQSFGAGEFTYRQGDKNGHITLLVHSEAPLSTVGGGRFRLTDVTATFYRDGKPYRTLFAASAEGSIDSKNWTLKGTRDYEVDAQGQTRFAVGDDFHTEPTTLATPEALQTADRPNEQMTTAELREKARVIGAGGDVVAARAIDVEIAYRLAVPFGAFIFALVGAPLAVSPRRSGAGVGFGFSVLIAFIYWIGTQFGVHMGQSGALPPVLAVWLPNIVGFCFGLYLLRQARG